MTAELNRVATGWSTAEIAARAFADLGEGEYVNLGIGLPTAILDAASRSSKTVVFHSENGVLGLAAPEEGANDPDMIDAGKNYAALIAGGCFFSHAESFAMIRGGHIDTAILGAYEVAANGDFANWTTAPYEPVGTRPSGRKSVPAVGGAIDLAAGARRVIVLMRTVRRGDELRLVNRCSLPLTGGNCVSRVYCDLGVFRPAGDGFVIEESSGALDDDELRKLFADNGIQISFAREGRQERKS